MNHRLRATAACLVVCCLVIFGFATTSGSASASTLDAEFHRSDYSILELPRTMWPYIASGPGPLEGTNTYDSEGVSVRVVGGVEYDHPVLQAQFMLTRLSSYGYNQSPEYLDRIVAHADRLTSNAVLSRGAMYLPYPFDWALHGDRDDMIFAPWYSAMAQGQALSAFVRLYEVTGDERYRKVADQLFASFLNLKASGVPWTVAIDSEGYLWFEEYAKDPGADRSVNGHIFAIYGLWDYYRLTGSHDAAKLFQGGVTAVEGHMSKIRNPGWVSRYSLENQEYMYPSYHVVHTGQLYQLYNMTGAASLAISGDRLLDDYPASQHGGRGYLSAGDHHAIVLDATGNVTSERRINLPAAEAVTMSGRHKIAGRDGIWLKVSSGGLAERWVRETPDKSFVKLQVENFRFHEPRLIRFQKGVYTGYRFNALGLRAFSKTFALTGNSGAHVDQRTVMNGVTYYRVVNGVWKDYWIAAQTGVALE